MVQDCGVPSIDLEGKSKEKQAKKAETDDARSRESQLLTGRGRIALADQKSREEKSCRSRTRNPGPKREAL